MKTIVFYDEGFPYDGGRPNLKALEQLAQSSTIVAADSLEASLSDPMAVCLVNLHAPYFPKAAWLSFLSFLRAGGGLLSVGGAPFKHPVVKMDEGWRILPDTIAYHEQLQIHEALPVDPAPISRLQHNPDIPWLEGVEELFSIEPTFGLILHVTKHRDQPLQSGSSGPVDAMIYPLLRGVSAEERDVAAPAVLMENTKDEFAGGRWVFINQTVGARFWEGQGVELLYKLARLASEGVTELWVKPQYASYYPTERPALTIQWQDLGRKAATADSMHTLELTLYQEHEGSEPLWSRTLQLKASAELSLQHVPIAIDVEPGLYKLEGKLTLASGEVRSIHQGFWGFDEVLLKQGTHLTCDRDYFRKDGRPFPVVGMTYMTSDVARKFVFLPNTSVWDKDMAQMRAAGINLLRTGFWTAWRSVMFVDGHAYEEVLRAVDAFFLTAKRHGLEVTFNFFSFTPEAWEGVNPYLDPRSVAAQKRFISALVSRHKESTHVQWDLINEPSMFDPKRIFSGPRPVADRYEVEAYRAWLQERHGSIEVLQDRWRMTPEQLPSFDRILPPEQSEINFDVEDMKYLKKGVCWLDYTLFTMEMHNRWARELTSTIKSLNPRLLVTVGQDEALGRGPRPSPFFYAEAVDYTTVHTWWLMDQLVWDGIFGKAPDKPSLIQETGIMYLETADNRAKRTEAELHNILERKYAYAFSTGGAGAVQWLWNTNYYMNNINESNIGAIRADGTAKPEADVSYDFGRFIGQLYDLFEGRQLEETAVIFPYSNDFSNRRFACEGTAALTRVLAYDLNVPFRALGEYHLDALKGAPPKLIIVPSAHNFSDEAMQKLVAHIEQYGGTLLVTGPISLDAYWYPSERLEKLIGSTRYGNVLREEHLRIGGEEYPVSFGQRRIAEVVKQTHSEDQSGPVTVKEYPLGKGKLLWCPLPVELNERKEGIQQLYTHALKLAGVQEELQWLKGGDQPGVYGRKLRFDQGSLYIFVSEDSADQPIEVSDPATSARYAFLLPSERSVLFSTDQTGAITAVYRPQDTVVHQR